MFLNLQEWNNIYEYGHQVCEKQTLKHKVTASLNLVLSSYTDNRETSYKVLQILSQNKPNDT